MSERILIVRTDRIGDVLLTTPVARLLKQRRPQVRVSFLVEKYTAPLLENNPDVDQLLIDPRGPMDQLVEILRHEQFDAAIVAFPRWRIAWALWRAGIPMRIGPASKWYSVFFTHRIWQHRSEGKKHEADYNLELLAPLGIPFERVPTRMVLTAEEKAWARATLEGYRIAFHKPVVILHPGSGGSSERWPLRGFMELGDRLQEQGCDVVVTSGPGEDYQYLMIDNMRRIPVFIAGGSVSLRQFAALVGAANLVVSNSTGPLHIAVALGIPTVSIYSPIPTCHPRRWGPYPDYVQGGGTHGVVVPQSVNDLPASVAMVSVDEVLALCQKRLNLRGVSVA